ncbi:MAG TPA: hypothetical protein VHF22_07875, partial [Planctomycetota bacterium]|nr:hypothetical protein [Planctomycetota bacterium]
RSSEDWDLWLRLAARHPFAFLEEPLTCYRRHPASATSDHFMTALNALAVVDRLLEREPGLRVRLAALRSRARAKIRLANVLYERGELRIARHLLLHHLPWLGAADGARLLATMLPAPVRAPGRAVWRRVRAC